MMAATRIAARLERTSSERSMAAGDLRVSSLAGAREAVSAPSRSQNCAVLPRRARAWELPVALVRRGPHRIRRPAGRSRTHFPAPAPPGKSRRSRPTSGRQSRSSGQLPAPGMPFRRSTRWSSSSPYGYASLLLPDDGRLPVPPGAQRNIRTRAVTARSKLRNEAID